MAKLLCDSGYEEQHRKLEWMAVSADTDVHLETMETAKDPKKKTDGAGLTGMGSL